MKRVLFFANDFPPIGGAGVQRPFYFAKYLPDFGWRPEVITVKDVVFPVQDPSLLDELPATATVQRTESLELRRALWHVRRMRRSVPRPNAGQDRSASSSFLRDFGRALRSWAFVPDDRMLWLPFAVWRALRVSHKARPDVILATVPPYSTAVIGYVASRLLRVPLVLDLRDPWTRDPYVPMPTAPHRWTNRAMEKTVVKAASRVIVISEKMADALTRDYPEVKDRVHVITNGYDREAFDRIESHRSDGGFDVVYVGSLYVHHLDALRAFLSAWSSAAAANTAFGAGCRFVVIGRVDPEIETVLKDARAVRSHVAGYVSHREAVSRLKGASALFFTIKNLDPAKHVITIPGKLFEYLAASGPVLMVGPPGDAADLVERAGGRVHREADHNGLVQSLLDLFQGRVGDAALRRTVALQFDRKHLTSRLAACLDDACRSDSKGNS